jgi:ABC-type bacteriocin/lantibiotic exporter with double-glycine peptidase domain
MKTETKTFITCVIILLSNVAIVGISLPLILYINGPMVFVGLLALLVLPIVFNYAMVEHFITKNQEKQNAPDI